MSAQPSQQSTMNPAGRSGIPQYQGAPAQAGGIGGAGYSPAQQTMPMQPNGYPGMAYAGGSPGFNMNPTPVSMPSMNSSPTAGLFPNAMGQMNPSAAGGLYGTQGPDPSMGSLNPPTTYQRAPGWTPQNVVTFQDTANYQNGGGYGATGQATGANYANTGLIGGTRLPQTDAERQATMQQFIASREAMRDPRKFRQGQVLPQGAASGLQYLKNTFGG